MQDNARKVLAILRKNYLSKDKPKIILFYIELTSLHKMFNRNDHRLYNSSRKNPAISLKTSGEIISDSLLIVMDLKRLLVELKPSKTVITQKDNVLTFSKFKVTLTSSEETEKNDRRKN